MANQHVVTLAGGCFWCLQPVFRNLVGVSDCVVGYCGGRSDIEPTYENIKMTGHAECVCVTFDDAQIALDDVLDVFFALHDPTQLNKQGDEDVGTQYRTAVFAHSADDAAVAQAAIKRAQASWEAPIVTTVEVVPVDNFRPAEDYHQDYFINNPQNAYCKLTVSKKLAKARNNLKHLLRPDAEAQMTPKARQVQSPQATLPTVNA